MSVQGATGWLPSAVVEFACEAIPVVFSAFKRRWPILTTIVAALLYLSNNYDIRGLDGLRLEPRAQISAPGGLAGEFARSPLGWPSSFPPNPVLPTSNYPSTNYPGTNYPSTSYPGANYPGSNPNFLGQSSPNSGVPNSGPSRSLSQITWPEPPGTSALANAPTSGANRQLPGQWGQMLSLGEKLGMLDLANAPVQPTISQTPNVQLQTIGASPVAAQERPKETLRIASFNMHGIGERSQSGAAMEQTVRILGQFDLVAIQSVRSRHDDVLPNLVSRLNANGRKFDFMIGPRVGRNDNREQFAFIFDTDRVETDRFQLYTVEDPEDMLHHEPLVGWFRALGTSSQDAFTFSLVNLRVDPDFIHSELETLPNLVQAVAADGRGEDDILLAGDFSASVPQLASLSTAGMRVLLDGIATTTRGNQQVDTIAFPAASTTEYTGRSGAYDFLRQFNMSLEQAVEISEHLPIWAEFSIMEGGRPGQVAGSAMPEHRFQNRIN